MKEKISIIVPCYNVDKVLPRCLDSIFAQNLCDATYEVICVDDKSTDKTLEILLEYEHKYSEKMIIISLDQNGKQGHARNVAFEYASGEYITYIDADDVIAPNMLKTLYECLKNNDCDIVECNCKTFMEDCHFEVETKGQIELYDMSDVSWKKACILRRFSRTAPWGRLYKRELLEDNNIFFPENVTMEDIYFSELSMAYMSRYMWIPQTLYFYYVNPNGTYYNPGAIKYYMDTMIVQNEAIDKIRELGLNKFYEEEYEYLYFIVSFCIIIRRMIGDKKFFSYDNYLWAYQETLYRYPNVFQNKYVLNTGADWVLFSIELVKRKFSKVELAMALYGESYTDVIIDEVPEENQKVSVLIVTQNQRTDLCITLDSIWKQSYGDIEVIVVDDASTDGTLDTIQKLYGEKDNLYYICNEEPVGMSASYNIGAESATGKWITFVNCGTTWDSERLEKQLGINSADQWSYCQVLIGNAVYPRLNWEDYKRREVTMPTLLLEKQIDLQGILMEKECFYEVGGFDENLAEQQEYDFLLRLSDMGSGIEYPEILVSAKYKEKDVEAYIVSDIYLLKKYENKLKKYGLKKEKVIQVLDNAGLMGKQDILWEYIEYILDDEDYAKIVQEYLKKHNLVRQIEECDTDTISGVKNCTGCNACAETCPVKAIHMKTDQGGFLRPEVDMEKCIYCGKCKQHCPLQIDLQGNYRKQICYAAQAKTNTRELASSGGVFPLLAEHILKKGGYVAGAVYTPDFSVKHVVSNCLDEVRQMYGSKYVQSDLRGVYIQVENLLKKDYTVLFSGVACQIAGLRAYLEKDYEKLYTIDVICHGVPSPGAWRRHVSELEKLGEIVELSFRDKKHLGWKTGLYVKYADGREVATYNDKYLAGFLNNWILRDSCYHCNFKSESYSDITLGDFWGITNIDNMYDDMGTSFVTLNSAKGEKLYQEIRDLVGICTLLPTSMAVVQNPSIENSVEDNELHRRMADICKKGDWERAQREVYQGLRFDVAMVCLWSKNYGNAITNYALYHTLQKGRSVLAIDTGINHSQGKFEEFKKRQFMLSSEYYGYREWTNIQKSCDTFMVGSDQVWNSKFTERSHWGNFFQLDFVRDDKKKISYASSFGQKGLEPHTEEDRRLYRRFQHISVREAFGVESCRELYGMTAEQVVDPVFLLTDREYDDLIRQWNPGILDEEEEPYIVAYLLSPTVEKRKFCERLQAQLNGMKIVYIIDNAMEVRDWGRHVLNFENVRVDLDVEEWLCYLRKADYVVTDSFHGTCFSIIFHKTFLSIVNRQTDRFQFFENLPGIAERILQKTDVAMTDTMFEEINYDVVDEKLERERERSQRWLDNALSKEERG